ncbi:sigma-70 family RNA polymerase sigma factor [Novipirellula sp.]|uniref:sigma-70 family RNA polymerase sigma factor n=1 Tax=Novipirellula sp. TaxID=2795430 RepID=UPI00356264D0
MTDDAKANSQPEIGDPPSDPLNTTDASKSAALQRGQLDRQREYTQRFEQHRRVILLYLRSLLPTQNDVDEVFQETCLVTWREFDRFQSGTNFAAWACTVAYNQVRAWRKRQSRERLRFSDDLTQLVSSELIQNHEHYDHYVNALDKCIEMLPEHHRGLIEDRYRNEIPLDVVAQQVNRSNATVRRMINRVREALRDCVSQRMRRDNEQ